MLPVKIFGGDLFAVIGVFVTVVGVLVAVATLLVALGQLIYPVWSERRRRRFLASFMVHEK